MQPTHDEILSELTTAEECLLDSAHSRYILFAGISEPDTEEQEARVAADRAAYPHLFKHGGDLPVYVDAYCVQFMASVSGLPVLWCQAWNDKDLEEAKDYMVRQKTMSLH